MHDALGVDNVDHRTLPTNPRDRPAAADYLVTAGQLNTEVERMAARLGCYVVVLPEGSDYLKAKAAKAAGELTLVGSDITKVRIA